MFNTTRVRLLTLLFAASACEGGADPCADYIEYICDCSDEEACDEATNTYADADSKLQDQCQSALEDYETADEESGASCSTLGDTGA